jgi:hypothetical protein
MRLAILFAISVCSVFCNAQTVRILCVRGNVQVRLHDKDVQAKTGLTINRSTPIKVHVGGVLSLLSSNGEMAELSGYVTTTPEKEFIKAKQSTATQRIARYLWSNLFNDNTAAVEQGTVYRSNTLQAVWPPSIVLDTPSVKLQWMSNGSMERLYVVSLFDDSDSLLMTQEVRDTFLLIDLNPYWALADERCLYWNVRHLSLPNSACASRCIQSLSLHEGGLLQTRIAEVLDFKSSDDAGESPLSLITSAVVLEEHGLYERALDFYSQAYEMEPSEDYLALAQKCRLRGLGD